MNPTFSPGGKAQYDKPLKKGGWQFDWNLQYHPLTQLVHKDDRVSFRQLSERAPKSAQHGDADFFVWQADWGVHYGLTERTEIVSSVSSKRIEAHMDDEDEHHRAEVFQGPGDFSIRLRHFLMVQPKYQIVGQLGFSLPTGRLKHLSKDAFLDHDEATALGVTVKKHSHLRLGTGTVDPILALEGLYRLSDQWMLYGNISAILPFYANRFGYRTQSSLNSTIGPALKIGKQGLIAALFVDAFWTGRDTFKGLRADGSQGRFGVPNTGRIQISLKPTLTRTLGKDWTWNLQVIVPLYTKIREDSELRDVQLIESVGGFMGISYNF